MAQYDFTQLSSHDFEVLCAAVLTADRDITFEIFRAGRDRGIDLRYSRPKGDHTTVVQCKHYAGSGYSKLYSHLKNEELSKVRTLKPNRYILITSVPMSPKNKIDIQDLFKPYIQTTGDVIARDDINLLLKRFPQIEKANFKLWLTSTAVLERVLFNAEQCQTDFAVEKIRNKLPIYVQNDCYPRALEILRADNVVIISGVPGVGKTTLAEMLIYSFMSSNFVPVAIRSDLREGRSLYNASIKQIFYFDDFLGQTFLREGRGFSIRNDDASIVDFVEMIQRSKNAKLIMTTREHLFSNALIGSERLRHSPIVDHKCVLAIGDYNKIEKAKILYNHIYFSGLPESYRRELTRESFYMKILEHRNFNPRLIEWLSSYRRIKNVSVPDYQEHVASILDEPHEIWRDAFFNQISSAARSLLLYIFSVGGQARLSQSERGWLKLHSHQSKEYNYEISQEGFNAALKEIEGSFANLKFGSIEFINPSIVDFLTAILRETPNYISDIIKSAALFKQLSYLWDLSASKGNQIIRTVIMRSFDDFVFSLQSICQHPPHEIVRKPTQIFYRELDTKREIQLILLLKIYTETNNERIILLIKQVAKSAFKSLDNAYCNFPEAVQFQLKLEELDASNDLTLKSIHDDFSLKLFSEVPKLENHADISAAFSYYRNAQDKLPSDNQDQLEETIGRYLEGGLADDIEEFSHDDTTLSEMRDFLEQIALEFGYNVDHEVASIDEAITKLNEPEDRDDDEMYDSIRRVDAYENTEQASIDNLFGSL